MLPGVDVSSFQGEPAAWRDAAGKIQWAAVKLTELQPNGTRYLNPDAAADWAFLRQQGKGRIAYLYGHAPVSAADTVSFFLSELAKLGLTNADGVAVDLEVTDGLGPAAVDRWGLDVLGLLGKALDRVPLFYSFPSFITAGNCASLGGYPLWLSNPSAAAGHPQVPAPWKSCAIQQTGITGAIDRDVAFYPDLAAMQAAIGKRNPPKVVHWRPAWPLTLAQAATRHNTTPEEMIALAAAAGWEYRPAMRAYIEKGDWTARLPAAVELFAPA
jgi:GH25 family lysozyme M1 (1,4-beta-N-acetylmuramidase)